ncbi:MAG TPA: hypothetical protein VFV28_01785, partial [Limnobacter sp.]|nr:hypothetical protein [Limnobacter sp.]
NSRVNLHLQPGLLGLAGTTGTGFAAGTSNSADQAESAAWRAIQASCWPADLARQCREFLEKYPFSQQAEAVGLYQQEALAALEVLRNPDVRLFKTSFVLPSTLAQARLAEGQTDLHRAARGDKDAAARVARLYRESRTETDQPRYVGWLQYAGALGNGIAAYELALHYREVGQPLLAAQSEALALKLGYSPPRSLGHSRK